MKKNLLFCLLMVIALVNPTNSAMAEEVRQSIADLSLEGYYIAPEDHAFEGLLFEDNQLLIYISDEHQLDDETLGQERVQWLADFHSFPYPDLSNYSESVRERYLSEDDLPYGLKATYEEITAMITPEMSQTDIQDLINNRIPGIYYTEKDGYAYYTIASPTVTEEEGVWHIQLFGQELLTLEETEGKLLDQEGVVYEYLAGITPN